MRKLFILILFLIVCNCFSQKISVTFYNGSWMLTEKKLAQFYRVGIIDSSNYHFYGEIQDFYINGNLQMKGIFRDNIKIDTFYFYYPDGSLKTQGYYRNNKRYGIWTNYYLNGNIRDKVVFNGNFLATIEFYEENGKPVIINGTGKWETTYFNDLVFELTTVQGHYKDTLRDGTWNYYTKNILSELDTNYRLQCTERYKDGIFIEGTYFWGGGGIEKLNSPVFEILPESAKFKRTENWEYTIYATIEEYPYLKFLPNKDSSLFPVDKLTKFPNGIDSLRNFFRNEMEFSKSYIKSQKGRSFIIEFVITEFGDLDIIEIPSKASLDLYPTSRTFYKKSLKAVKSLPRWNPAVRDGKNAKNFFMLFIYMEDGIIDIQLSSMNEITHHNN